MPERPGAADRRHVERRLRRHRGRIARRQLGEERRLAHRLEHVEVVVAGGAVGAEAERRRRRPGTSSPAPTPLASFMLLSGLCETPTLRRFRIAMSSSVTQTPCAASVRGPQKPIDSR